MRLEEHEIPTASEETLRFVLLTIDGQGREFKTKILEELLRRARQLDQDSREALSP